MPKLSPEERALVAAIIADPDDDTLRLAYADWLDEHADELPRSRRKLAKIKAQLIRLQVEEAGLILGAPDFDERHDELQSRIWNLLDSRDLYQSMVSELRGVTPARGLQFYYRRGLFGEVGCTVKYFVQHGATLLRAAPITAVRLKQLADSNFSKLVYCKHLWQVRALKFDAAATPVDVLAPFLHVGPLLYLRGLHFDSSIIDGTSDAWHNRAGSLAIQLAMETRLARLKRLSLVGAGVSSNGGLALARAAHLEGLELLDLRDNPGLGGAKAALRKRFGKRVLLSHADVKGLRYDFDERD